MNIHQYIHLKADDQIEAVRQVDGSYCVTITSSGHAACHLFLSEEQGAALEASLAQPRHARHTVPLPA